MRSYAMRQRLRAVLILLLLAVCKPHAAVDAGPRLPPAWLLRHFEDSEVAPFTGYSVPGVDLYEVTWMVMDAGAVFVVGLGRRDGKLLEGAELFARIARERLPPRELARRAYGVAIPKAYSSIEFLESASDCARITGRSDRCAVVEPPHIEGGALVFFAFGNQRGEEHPLEHRVELATGEARSRTDLEVFRERGLPVDVYGPECRALASCGRWTGCERVVGVGGAVPEGATHRRFDVRGAPQYLGSVRTCEGDRCSVAFAEDGHFHWPSLVPLGETCPTVARPTSAPFACVPIMSDDDVTGCRQVEAPRPPR